MTHCVKPYPQKSTVLALAHIAFEVGNVKATLKEVINAGGNSIGEVVAAAYPDGLEAVFVYAQNPEGNIIELQSWKRIKD
ncbi:MAG TPA: hypothetical protein DHW78_08600 [Ruminococcaceae bacterium]|jgi:predicted enzyme related to lactoylglutathione lyase|nr:hypothetical protein [Oscillospiraceae bacterium]HCM24365.1 hypothetical protein [Oscillospiraceae bacterium]